MAESIHIDYKLNGYYASYDGEMKDGKRNGRGYYHRFSQGGRRHSYEYEGEWLDDVEHGQGIQKISSEEGVHCATVTEIYTGGFKEGKRHGHGVIVKDHFDGSFTDGEDRFEGEFEDGNMVRHGVWEYANGDRFEGDFSSVPAHGTYTMANGQAFEGEWKNGHFDVEGSKQIQERTAPSLFVSERHSGFDYHQSARFFFPAVKGFQPYEKAITLFKDSNFQMNGAGIEILDVTEDTVRYLVKAEFTKDRKDFEDSIRRGETKKYERSVERTATIYDDDYDYTVDDCLEISCK